jgi:hypothetical protein
VTGIFQLSLGDEQFFIAEAFGRDDHQDGGHGIGIFML